MKVMSASTPNTPRTAPPPATSAIGSWNGMASQFSLPSISASRLLLHRRTPGTGGARLLGYRRRVLDNALEQRRVGRAIGRRRHGVARFGQSAPSGLIGRRAPAPHPRHPPIQIPRPPPLPP